VFDSSTDGTSLRCKYLFCKLVTSFAVVQRRAGGLNWKITVYSRLSAVRLEKLLEWHVDEIMFYFVFFFDLSLLFCMWNEWCVTSAVGSKPLWKLVSQRFDKPYSCQLQLNIIGGSGSLYIVLGVEWKTLIWCSHLRPTRRAGTTSSFAVARLLRSAVIFTPFWPITIR
jgi:hypothetical protein